MRRCPGGGLTCVRRARVEQCVCVGDELQLSVQVGQDAAGQSHVHLTVTFDLHAVDLSCHVQRPQSRTDVHLQQATEKQEVNMTRGEIDL